MPKAVVYRQYGVPAETVEVVDLPAAAPGPGQVLVENVLAPINPADLNTVEGKYPVRYPLPATPGVEGVATVAEVGPGVTGFQPGQAVLLPHGYGTWREGGVVEAESLFPVPEGVPYAEAAMIKINPCTAWRMLHDFVAPQPGAWVVQNAGNSGVGRAVIAIAQKIGLRTVSLVRRPELIEELTAAGGDVVLLDDDNAKAEIKARTEGAKIYLGLNSVGGESATRVANALAQGGKVITFGAMSRQPMKIPTGLLIFKDIRFLGFWMTRWYQSATEADARAMYAELLGMAREGAFKTPIDRVYPVTEIQEAVTRALQGGRAGKVLLGKGL
ncbi:MAG: 2-enoyl thioester reductase domain-containing protein [Chthoniobacteraceae bacterium]|nr:2-enoyl thioester reductase domain-containing protein [Chthoniobacteraceae bacterium]